MIFQSVPLMTGIDLFVLGVGVYLSYLWIRHRATVRRLGLETGLGATLVGVLVVACLYLADLYSMYVMPSLRGHADAMRFMRQSSSSLLTISLAMAREEFPTW